MSTYLITGGAGFLGSHLAAAAMRKGVEVVIADDLLTGDMANVPAGCRFVHIDLTDPDQYYKLGSVRPDAILHCAGQSSGEISFDSPIRDLAINTEATIRLAQWGLAKGCSRFLYASSVSVYGNGSGRPMRESDVEAPVSFYGCSKLASEKYLLLMKTAAGLEPTIFRLFNLYGPGQNLKNLRQGMVSIYLGLMLSGRPLAVKGSLDRRRDFVFVQDCVDTWISAVENTRTFGEVINVGTGTSTSVRDIIELLRRALKRPDYPISEAAGTPGDAFQSVADVSKLHELAGFIPRTPPEEGITSMVSRYLLENGEARVEA